MSVKSFFGNWFVKNFLALAGIIVFLIIFLHVFLDVYTRHGKVVEVPNLMSVNIEDAEDIADSLGFEIEITDSIFTRSNQAGAILDQKPVAGKNIKGGRKVKVVIRAVEPKEVPLKNMIDMNIREANDVLESKGFEIGKITYDAADYATDRISRVSVKGRTIQSRQSHDTKDYDEGTVLDLTVGLGSDNQTNVPDVMGMTYAKARHAIHHNFLNASRCRFDDSVKDFADSCNAVVVRQVPAGSDLNILKGTEVSLTLSVNPSKINK